MTNKELISKIREEILHLKMKELQRTNGINTGADVYLSSYAVLSILSNVLTEESEDERIRKWLVEYFGSIKETVWIHRDITCEQILAWLEKQKEQKPAEKQDYSGLNDLERAIHRGFLCAGVENVPVTIIKETARDCLAQMKPAEWSDYKDKIDIQYCSSEPEWSEEDEHRRQQAINALDRNGYYVLVDWLKSLRPSWKPSEDEERLINTSISFLKDFADKGYENAVECIDWLKSKLNGNTCK